jgi:hypothetical protein
VPPPAPVGVWRVADGSAQVNVMPCHGALCGSVGGKRILIRMKPNGDNLWTGTIVDVRDGTQYAGKISMQGDRCASRAASWAARSAAARPGRASARSSCAAVLPAARSVSR